MIGEELHQSKKAEEYIKTHKDLLIEKFANDEGYVSDIHPVSLFMAGSPGAGKTEVSKRLIEKFESKPVRIDIDEIRSIFPNYNGTNAHIFQSACTMGVSILRNYIVEKTKFNMILDATFAYHGALDNVKHSLHRKRVVEIYYIYQSPHVAWEVTQKREIIEHRRVSKEIFVKSFIQARENVDKAKETFGNQLTLNLIIKDLEKNTEQVWLDIELIDQFLPMRYTMYTLEKEIR